MLHSDMHKPPLKGFESFDEQSLDMKQKHNKDFMVTSKSWFFTIWQFES